MKVTMEFNLPDDRYEYALAYNAHKYFAALDDIRSEIRKKIKYENKEDWQQFQDMFYDIIEEREVSMDLEGEI